MDNIPHDSKNSYGHGFTRKPRRVTNDISLSDGACRVFDILMDVERNGQATISHPALGRRLGRKKDYAKDRIRELIERNHILPHPKNRKGKAPTYIINYNVAPGAKMEYLGKEDASQHLLDKATGEKKVPASTFNSAPQPLRKCQPAPSIYLDSNSKLLSINQLAEDKGNSTINQFSKLLTIDELSKTESNSLNRPNSKLGEENENLVNENLVKESSKLQSLDNSLIFDNIESTNWNDDVLQQEDLVKKLDNSSGSVSLEDVNATLPEEDIFRGYSAEELFGEGEDSVERGLSKPHLSQMPPSQETSLPDNPKAAPQAEEPDPFKASCAFTQFHRLPRYKSTRKPIARGSLTQGISFHKSIKGLQEEQLAKCLSYPKIWEVVENYPEFLLQDLTPKQIVSLSAYIAGKSVRYNHSQADAETYGPALALQMGKMLDLPDGDYNEWPVGEILDLCQNQRIYHKATIRTLYDFGLLDCDIESEMERV